MTRRGLLALLLPAGPALVGAAPAAAWQEPGFPYGDLKEVTHQGKLVSLASELTRKYGARTRPDDADRQWGLALPEGQFYTLLENENYRKLLASGLKGQPVQIKARHFPRSMILEVLVFGPAPAEALRRRFYCGVCDITGDDFGPCVCCGKEMQLVDPSR
jgi:hypothetical protein